MPSYSRPSCPFVFVFLATGRSCTCSCSSFVPRPLAVKSSFFTYISRDWWNGR